MQQETIRWGALLTFLFTTLFIWYTTLQDERQLLRVAFLDVGQGDAVFIEGPNGNQMLIDAGEGPAVLRELSSVMPFHDRSIDVVVATHPDKDHIGGIPDVLGRFDVDLLLRSGADNDTAIFEELETLIESGVVEEVIARRGMTIDLGEGAFAEVLFPDRAADGLDPNNASIILRIVYGESEVMLTGDAPQSIETYVAALDEGEIESDILKVGHHGSRTSSNEGFIAAVAPQVAVVSAGRDNRYGHPHQEVIGTFENFEIPLISTYEEGTIIFESDGTMFYRVD